MSRGSLQSDRGLNTQTVLGSADESGRLLYVECACDVSSTGRVPNGPATAEQNKTKCRTCSYVVALGRGARRGEATRSVLTYMRGAAAGGRCLFTADGECYTRAEPTFITACITQRHI